MHLYCYRKMPNFGDALNEYLWPKFINTKLEEKPGSEEVFVGIGTILNERLPSANVLHIFGSGFGYGSVDKSTMKNWEVHFVRGPITAKSLSLHPDLAISDPALLLHRTETLGGRKDIQCAFMPHHKIHSERMRRLCEETGIHYISPEDPCNEVLEQLQRSERLICSAMHGAIAAEALRIPWLPVITHDQMLLSKWHDWGASIQTNINFERLPTIWPHNNKSLTSKIAATAKEPLFRKRLQRLSQSRKFQLGTDAILEDKLSRMEEKINRFNEKFKRNNIATNKDDMNDTK